MAAVMSDENPKATRAVVVSALRLEDGESSPVVFEWYIKSRPVEFYQSRRCAPFQWNAVAQRPFSWCVPGSG
jgi:hypothetical protein